MPFSEAEKIAYPPFKIVEPIWDAQGITDAQKARSLVAVGYALGTLTLQNTAMEISGGKEWLALKLGNSVQLEKPLREEVLKRFDEFVAKNASVQR